MPKLSNIKRHAGIAGQYSISVDVEYPDEGIETLQFVGSTNGGPIVMVTPAGQTFVSSGVTDRLGSKLTTEWVERFFDGGDASL